MPSDERPSWSQGRDHPRQRPELRLRRARPVPGPRTGRLVASVVGRRRCVGPQTYEAVTCGGEVDYGAAECSGGMHTAQIAMSMAVPIGRQPHAPPWAPLSDRNLDGAADRRPPNALPNRRGCPGELAVHHGPVLPEMRPTLVVNRNRRVRTDQPEQFDAVLDRHRVAHRPRHPELDSAQMQQGGADLDPGRRPVERRRTARCRRRSRRRHAADHPSATRNR